MSSSTTPYNTRHSRVPPRYKNEESNNIYDPNDQFGLWIRFYKGFLSSLSDESFLSSIHIINLRDKYIQVKKGYWKTLFSLALPEEKRIRSRIAIRLKTLFLDRFCLCSATKIKKFFLKQLSSSFFDFQNILLYSERIYVKNPEEYNPSEIKKFKSCKKGRYFERKALRYRNYLIENNLDHNQFMLDISDENTRQNLDNHLNTDDNYRNDPEYTADHLTLENEALSPLERQFHEDDDSHDLQKFITPEGAILHIRNGEVPYIYDTKGQKQTDVSVYLEKDLIPVRSNNSRSLINNQSRGHVKIETGVLGETIYQRYADKHDVVIIHNYKIKDEAIIPHATKNNLSMTDIFGDGISDDEE